MSLKTVVGAAALCQIAGLLLAAPLEAEESEYGVLFEAEGVEETYYNCIACHSERIVAQQGLTREGWDELLDWMVEEQGMPELDAETNVIVLDYLSNYYNTDRPHFPKD